jgi:hypothetical protein
VSSLLDASNLPVNTLTISGTASQHEGPEANVTLEREKDGKSIAAVAAINKTSGWSVGAVARWTWK